MKLDRPQLVERFQRHYSTPQIVGSRTDVVAGISLTSVAVQCGGQYLDPGETSGSIAILIHFPVIVTLLLTVVAVVEFGLFLGNLSLPFSTSRGQRQVAILSLMDGKTASVYV